VVTGGVIVYTHKKSIDFPLGTARLCEHYARDERVGELLKGEKVLRKQAEPLVQALTRAIIAFPE